MSVPRLSGAAWSFVGASLTESVGIWRAIGVHTIDLLAVPGSIVDSDKIVRQPSQEAAGIRALGVPVANLIFLFAGNFTDRALNHKDREVRLENTKTFEAAVEFCRLSGIPSITVLPGVDQPGWSHAESLATSAEALNELAAIAATKGIVFLFEAHVQSVLESPEETLHFVEQNPKLKLTLDYAHFVYQGFAQRDIDSLAPYAGHVHLRQAGPQVLQARWDDGAIDFREVVRVLQQANFSGYYALEYEHDPWLGNDKVDVMSETIKMRNTVTPLLAGQ